MHTSPGVGAALAAASIVVALYCATSLVIRGRALARGPLAEANHVVMALAMAAMFVPVTADLVPPVAGLAVSAVVAVGWLAVALVRRARGAAAAEAGPSCGAHPVHLAAIDAAMAVMYAAMLPTAAGSAMPGMPGMDAAGGMAAGMATVPGTKGANAAALPGGGAGVLPAAPTTPTVVVVLAVLLGAYLLVHAARSVGGAMAGGVVAAGPVPATATAGGPGGLGVGVLGRVAESPRIQLSCQALMSAIMGAALLTTL